MTRYTGQTFLGLEKVLREMFLPRIFFGKSKPPPPIVGSLSTFPTKKSGMGLQNHVMSEKDKCTSLICASDNMIGALKGKRFFPITDNIREVKGRVVMKKITVHRE